MIDEDKTFEKFGYRSTDLRDGSGKKIVVSCDGCGADRDIERKQYRALCNGCASKKRFTDDPTLSVRQAASLRQRHLDDPTLSQTMSDAANRRWADPEMRAAMSETKKQYFIDHPEAREAARLKAIDQWNNQMARDIQSEILKSSDECKTRADNQRGGDDIVNHHFIYDHTHPENHTIQITRSAHTAHHHWMDRAGIEVPHINIEIPWRYIK